MKFNELQSRLWVNMLQSIESFKVGELSFFNLIYGLEGSLDAGDFNDKELIVQWYDYWSPLEIYMQQRE